MKVEIKIDPEALARRRVIAIAQEDIRAGDQIEIDGHTGKARRARFGNATAAQVGEQELEQRP